MSLKETGVMDEVAIWKLELATGLLRAALAAMAAGVLIGSYYAVSLGALWLIPQYLVLLVLVALANFWPGMPRWLRLVSPLLIIYAVAIVDFVEAGRTGSARLGLVILPGLALLLFDRRAGLLTLGLALLTMAVFGRLFSAGILVVPPQTISSANPAIWLSNTILLLIHSALLLVSISYLVNRLVRTVSRLRASVEERDRLLSLQQAVFEATADGILVVDRQGRRTTFNRQFVEMWALPEAVMATEEDQVALAFVEDQVVDPPDFAERVRYLYEHPEMESFETLTLKDSRVIERSSRPQRLGEKITGRVWTFRDISQRRQAELELRQKNEDLERFAYTVSHDLKSPLVTIQVFLGYLEKDIKKQDEARIAGDMDHIRAAAAKMARLLDELLELSRIGRKVNPPGEAPLQAVVGEALELVAGRISQRGVDVRVTGEPYLLVGDRPRLVEIFQNLLDNAVKFMGDQPAPVVEVGVEKGGGGPVLFVRDNGLGIDPRYQPRLFGLFEKLDPATDGTGIGLAIVKRIVEHHGGKIWVESAGLGHGTTFYFTLARIKAGL